jgi:glycosyltransferase involved in cell wall biosynthesis
MLRYERSAAGRFDHVIAVSESDRDLMMTMTDPSRISVAPTGVDLAQFRAAAGESATEPLVMFVGSMDWEANIDGCAYFCREIWPQIKRATPGALLRIVGRNPDRRVKGLASEDVEVTGSVPSVIEHLRQAAVVVVPLRIGGGTRLKIFEAMAAGRAVVSTSIGAEGLPAENGTHLLLADTADTFAQSVVRLLRDVPFRSRIEHHARTLVASRYDWAAAATEFERCLMDTHTTDRRNAGSPLSATWMKRAGLL